ncbi:MAG: helix-turn-helix domain-containing protein [Pseudomonadota bacterium]|jgi:transcriptional regulator with XRE-family HTH domain|uniref:helix-turn-helix domain-containing protein n=1 Tax=Burkholderiaceae TaxID=119060 RepID=UPI0010F69821|nr:helix-turn-helix domain-containing protein [Burkholderia sp. 4M9327F10]
MARSLDPAGPRPAPQVADLDELGELVRHRRLELELRIDDAAHACGVAANVMSRLENGKPVGADRLLRVLSGLGLAMLVTSKEEAIWYQSPRPLKIEGHAGKAPKGAMGARSPGAGDDDVGS